MNEKTDTNTAQSDKNICINDNSHLLFLRTFEMALFINAIQLKLSVYASADH